MTVDEAKEIVRALQAGIDSRDRGVLLDLFHEDAVLIGTSGYAPSRIPYGGA